MSESGTEVKYIFTELDSNTNKYWEAHIDGCVVTLRWGRIALGDPGQSKEKTFPYPEDAQKFFDSKVHEKERKGYTIQKTVGAAPAKPTPGNLAAIARKQIVHDGDDTRKLIDFLVQRNIHAIEGTTNIRFDAETGLFTTPRGVVTTEGIKEASDLLDNIARYVRTASFDAPEFRSLVDSYLRIVPQDIGRKRIGPRDVFGSMDAVKEQKQLLDTLRTVVKDAEQRATDTMPAVFRTKLTLVDANSDEFKRINDKYKRTSNSHHTSARYTLKRVWKVEVAGADEAFEQDGKKVGGLRELWHGTKDSNLLSLLKSGYVVPGHSSSIQVTGRMFGDGIYFSDQSTKSLNYATGYWGGKSSRCFMLLNDVAMGKGFVPTGPFSGGCRPGYDSTFAKARSSGVMNNEMIVYRTSQIRPKFLCEFS